MELTEKSPFYDALLNFDWTGIKTMRDAALVRIYPRYTIVPLDVQEANRKKLLAVSRKIRFTFFECGTSFSKVVPRASADDENLQNGNSGVTCAERRLGTNQGEEQEEYTQCGISIMYPSALLMKELKVCQGYPYVEDMLLTNVANGADLPIEGLGAYHEPRVCTCNLAVFGKRAQTE